jgi:hypothetical protein
VSTQIDEVSAEVHEHGDSIPETRPWREAGWIFRDGHAFAIERLGNHTRARAARFSHLRDE